MTKTINVQATKVFEARPLAELVAKANEFSSKIMISMDNKTVNAKSIMGVMGLGIEVGKDFCFCQSLRKIGQAVAVRGKMAGHPGNFRRKQGI